MGEVGGFKGHFEMYLREYFSISILGFCVLVFMKEEHVYFLVWVLSTFTRIITLSPQTTFIHSFITG